MLIDRLHFHVDRGFERFEELFEYFRIISAEDVVCLAEDENSFLELLLSRRAQLDHSRPPVVRMGADLDQRLPDKLLHGLGSQCRTDTACICELALSHAPDV